MDCWSFVYGSHIRYSVSKYLFQLNHICKHQLFLIRLQFANKSDAGTEVIAIPRQYTAMNPSQEVYILAESSAKKA